VKFKFYNYNTDTKLQKEAAESAKKQVLVPILDPQNSVNELFKVFSSLINIHSIMIEIHGEVDQKLFSYIFYVSKISENFKNSQVSN
jgi:ligand-binding sensor protein